MKQCRLWRRIAAFFEQLSAENGAANFACNGVMQAMPKKPKSKPNLLKKLKCEVVAQALLVYLNNDFAWLLNWQSGQERQTETSQLENLTLAPQQHSVQDWQTRLYFLLHLVPVGEVSSLLHQLRKWQVLEHKATTDIQDSELYAQCAQVLSLYLDMHDAKFDGGEAMQVDENFAACFESQTVFHRVYPPASADAPMLDDKHLPKRGLRELLRFGHMNVLLPIFKCQPIRQDNVKQLEGWEYERNGTSSVSAAQDTLANLHKKWVDAKDKKSCVAGITASYQGAPRQSPRTPSLGGAGTLDQSSAFAPLVDGGVGALGGLRRLVGA